MAVVAAGESSGGVVSADVDPCAEAAHALGSRVGLEASDDLSCAEVATSGAVARHFGARKCAVANRGGSGHPAEASPLASVGVTDGATVALAMAREPAIHGVPWMDFVDVNPPTCLASGPRNPRPRSAWSCQKDVNEIGRAHV